MNENTKWFENAKEARDYFVGQSRTHGVVFEAKEAEQAEEEPKKKKKKTSPNKKADKNE